MIPPAVSGAYCSSCRTSSASSAVNSRISRARSGSGTCSRMSTRSSGSTAASTIEASGACIAEIRSAAAGGCIRDRNRPAVSGSRIVATSAATAGLICVNSDAPSAAGISSIREATARGSSTAKSIVAVAGAADGKVASKAALGAGVAGVSSLGRLSLMALARDDTNRCAGTNPSDAPGGRIFPIRTRKSVVVFALTPLWHRPEVSA